MLNKCKSSAEHPLLQSKREFHDYNLCKPKTETLLKNFCLRDGNIAHHLLNSLKVITHTAHTHTHTRTNHQSKNIHTNLYINTATFHSLIQTPTHTQTHTHTHTLMFTGRWRSCALMLLMMAALVRS